MSAAEESGSMRADRAGPGDSPSDGHIDPVAAALVLGLGMLISHGFGLALVPAMLPRISSELDVGYGVLGAAVATGLVAYSAGALSTSWILNRVPGERLLVASYCVSALGLLVSGVAPSTLVLTVGVVILGFVAPLSWSATIHVAGSTTAGNARAAVMASASGGAALGVLINGVLVQSSNSLHSWRLSFVMAAALATLPIVGGLLLYRRPIDRPLSSGSQRAGYRRVLGTRPGRVIIMAGLVAGVGALPFNVFLTATAIDEMHVSALGAAAVWWLIGIVGMAAGPVFGRYANRASALTALTAGAIAYGAGLAVLTLMWNYLGLLIAAVGYSVMNYPIWGLAGAIANDRFDSGLAVRSISLGLIIASLSGAAGNAAAGAWIDATSSFRVPVAAMAALATILSAWFWVVDRSGDLENPASG